ncbi:MAG: hypothetical protein WD845_06470 [Pirellulales bacterium]
MAKLLLSLVLAATQLLSWSAAPLYLCVCDSDSLCIDAGPDDCNCCHEDEAIAQHDAIVEEHDHDASAWGLTAACDCRHVELSLAGPATAVRGADQIDSGKLVALPSLATLSPALFTADISLLRTPPGEMVAPDFYALAILGSVVLRC